MSTRRSLAAQDGRRSTKAQGDVRTSSTGRNFARKAERRSRDRGSRIKAALATGSYEGSLTMEGIPGSHEPSFVTVRWSRRSWRLPPRLNHAQPPLSPTRRGVDRVNRARSKGRERKREEGEATGMSEARSNRHRGKTTPTLAIPLRQRKEREAPKECRSSSRQSGSRRRETPGPPDKPRGSQSPRGAHATKVAERTGNERGAGARSFSHGWQKSVGRISRLAHRRVARLGGGISRALARRKLEARSDAGHEQRKGEAVRGCM
jgi:hypothetical protein